MDTTEIKIPLYSVFMQILVGVIAFFYLLYVGQSIIVPIIFAIIIAILLNPVVNFLLRHKINRIVAILLALFIAFMFLVTLLFFIGSQATMFTESFPQIQQNFSVLFDDIVNWISVTFNISQSDIYVWLEETKAEALGNGAAFVSQTIGTISGVSILVSLLPVYIFMFLFYKQLLLDFISQLFQRSKHTAVAEVLVETKSLIQNYLVGLLVEAAIVATLNSIGLLIIGIDYAILLGIIGALLNIIPYIGGIVGIALPMIIAIGTKNPVSAVWVFIAYIVVQFIDNNFIVPKIVASKVKVNALASIIVVVIGGTLWGVSGMFLAIPLAAVGKIIFDRIPSLKPFGFVIGENQEKRKYVSRK